MSNGTATLPEQEVRAPQPVHEEEPRRKKEMVVFGTTLGGLVAAGAGILAILGLAQIYPAWMVTIATGVLGASFLFEAVAITARAAGLLQETTEGKVSMGELGVGSTGETLAGLAGIVLGILSLLGVSPAALIPCAAFIFGAALMIEARANVRIKDMLTMYGREHPMAPNVVRQVVLAAIGLQVLVGLAALVLGITALAGVAPLTLSLAAVLVVSAVLFLRSNALIVGRLLSYWQH